MLIISQMYIRANLFEATRPRCRIGYHLPAGFLDTGKFASPRLQAELESAKAKFIHDAPTLPRHRTSAFDSCRSGVLRESVQLQLSLVAYLRR